MQAASRKVDEIPEELSVSILKRKVSFEEERAIQKRMGQASSFFVSHFLTITVSLLGLCTLALAGYGLYEYFQHDTFAKVLGQVSLPVIGGLAVYGLNFLFSARSSHKLHKIEIQNQEIEEQLAAVLIGRGGGPAASVRLITREMLVSLQAVELKKQLTDIKRDMDELSERLTEQEQAFIAVVRAAVPEGVIPKPELPFLNELRGRHENAITKIAEASE